MFRKNTLLFGLLIFILFSINLAFAQSGIFDGDRSHDRDHDYDHYDFDVKGHIDAIYGDTIEVKGFAFVVDSETVIEKQKHMSLSFSDLTVGDFVEVDGTSLSDSVFLAKKIKLENDEYGDYEHDYELDMHGMIEVLGSDYIEVEGTRFYVNDETRIWGRKRMELQFSDLTVNMYVEVEGFMQQDSTYLAKKIVVNEEEDYCRFGFDGYVDSIDVDYIVVDSMRFYVDSATKFYKDRRESASFSDLLVGQKVVVQASKQDDGTYLASWIKILNKQYKRMVFTGAIDSVGTDFIMVFGYQINIDSTTRIYNYRHNTYSFSDLEKGLRVQVKGYKQDDGTIQASEIKIRAFWQNYSEFNGTIEDLGSDWITVNGVRFSIDSTTRIYTSHKRMISLEQLIVGQLVEIKALLLEDNTWLAKIIKLEDNHTGEIEITGTIVTIGEDTLVVGGITFVTDEYTAFCGFKDDSIQFSDLEVGQMVEIEGYPMTDSRYYAKKIRLDDDSSLYVFSGYMDAKSVRSVMVSNRNVWLNTKTTILDKYYKPTDLADISLGSVVTVWAMTGGQNDEEALQIKVGKASAATGIYDDPNINNVPEQFTLKQNYPNPFNPETTIPFTIQSQLAKKVELNIYNIVGQKIRTLFAGNLSAGTYEYKWDATNDAKQNVASGIYFYQLKIGGKQQMKRMILIR